MKKIGVKKLTLENFNKYGTFANMINPDAVKIGAEPVEFFRDMMQVYFGTKNISFSICRVLKRPAIIDTIEYHSSCTEGILPLDADVLIHVAIATLNGEVPSEEIEVFHIPKGTLVSLKPGVWHYAPYLCDSDQANTLVLLPERAYANDCHVVELDEKDHLEITI